MKSPCTTKMRAKFIAVVQGCGNAVFAPALRYANRKFNNWKMQNRSPPMESEDQFIEEPRFSFCSVQLRLHNTSKLT